MRTIKSLCFRFGLTLWLVFYGLAGSTAAGQSASAPADTETARLERTLDGAWQMVKVASLDDPLPAQGWVSFQVPGVLDGYNYERAWFRRSLDIPQEWQGRRLLLRFGGVKYNSRVLINRQPVGGCYNGYDAFEVDITQAVRFGQSNELLVGVHDWTGVFSGDRLSIPEDMDWDTLRTFPADRILSPIGGLFTLYGIWDSVTLRAVPQVYIQSLFVRPLLDQKRLEVDVTVQNTGQRAFQAALNGRLFVWQGGGRDQDGQWAVPGEPVAVFPAVPVALKAGQNAALTLRLDQPPLETWSPATPTLYILEVGFDQPGTDRLRQRIGYRQFTVKGSDFYLNGNKVHLLATSWWPPSKWVSDDYIRGQLRGIRAMNAVAFRTHTQPWPQRWYELADEIGLMMIPEGAIWNDDSSYRVRDARFWENYGAHLLAMVRNLGNHPSVVMWSLENEFYGDRVRDGLPSEERLAEMGRLVKQADPTRPITFESDGDPGGVTDVIGVHYPNEYPDERLWPQDANWLEEPRQIGGGGGMFWDDQPFLWDRKKPLYVGEYLWSPSRDPSTHTLFFGDEAYIDYSAYSLLAKAFAWRMQMLTYRQQDVSGHSPWSVDEGPLDESNPLWLAQRDLYRPLAAFLLDYDAHFYSGETVERRVAIFNDSFADQPALQLRWALLDGEHELSSGTLALALKSGEQAERILRLTMPVVSDRKQVELRLKLSSGGKRQFSEAWKLSVFPRPAGWAMPAAVITLYDPQGTLEKAWQDLAVKKLTRLQDWDGRGLLVIGPGALKASASEEAPVTVIGANSSERALLQQKVQAGGRVLALEQSADASAWLPARLGQQSSTLAFPQTPSHPVLQGLSAEDFRWWRGDLLVSVNEPERAALAGFTPLVVTGSAQGLAHAPLAEFRQGQGVWLICQLQVGSKLGREPLAQVLLERMLAYLAAYQPPRSVVYWDAGGALPQAALPLELDWQPLANWDSLRSAPPGLLVLRGAGAELIDHLDQLRSYLQAGGTVLWDRPAPPAFEQVRQAWQLPVEMLPYQGAVQKGLAAAETRYAGLAREDLYWLGAQPGGYYWTETPLAMDVAEAVFSPSRPLVVQDTRPATQDVELAGDLVTVSGAEVAFYANGQAGWEVILPASPSGMYQFSLEGRGDPAAGAYPLANVALDGQPIGMLSIASRTHRFFSLYFRATPGTHRLTVSFSNDLYQPPEDRNLYIARWGISPTDALEPGWLLTTPPALVELSVGRGRLVLSAIRWDQAGENQTRALRFFANLLTTLGGRGQSRASLAILEAEAMTPQPGMSYFSRLADHVFLATGGYLQAQVQVAQAGRYRVGLVAKGSAVAGVYPLVSLELDGRNLGQFNVASDSWNVFYLTVDLPAGEHTLRLNFVNDAWAPEKGEDRNLWLDRLTFQQSP